MAAQRSERELAIKAFGEQIKVLFNSGKDDDFQLARYLEKRRTAFENMTDEEFLEEYNSIMDEEDKI